MAKTKQVEKAVNQQTHSEPIRKDRIRNLTATQIERIVNIWRKIECHANTTLPELLTLFDSRPETNERDINSVEKVLLFYGQHFKASAQSSDKSVRYAKYVIFKIESKLGQPIRGNEVPPPEPNFDDFFDLVYS